MPNMSHCRFSNTLADLRDCQEAMDATAELREAERAARLRLIELCAEIARDFGNEVA